MPKILPPGLLRLLGLEAEEAIPQISGRVERIIPPEPPPSMHLNEVPESKLPMLRPSSEAEVFTPIRNSSDDIIETTARSVDDVTPVLEGTVQRPGMSFGKKAAIGAAGLGLYGLLGGSDEEPPKPPVSPTNEYTPDKNKINISGEAQETSPTDKDEMNALKDKLKKSGLIGQPELPSTNPSPSMNLDVGESKLGSVSGLEAAQARRNNIQLTQNLSEAADLLGSGISGRKPLPKGTFDLSKQADQQVSDFLAKVDEQKNDPDSPVSKAFREYLNKFNINVKGDFTAAIGEKLMPTILKAFEADESNKLKAFISKENLKDRQNDLLLKLEEKKEAAAEKKKNKEEDFKHDMRKELIQGPGKDLYNAYVKSSLSIQRLEDAITNPSGYKDLGNIYNYLKALDSDSAVREGELALGISVGSIPQKLHASFVKFLTGEMLDPSQRKQMLDVVKNYHGQNKDAYESYIAPAVAQGRRLGYDMNEIVRPLGNKVEKPTTEKPTNTKKVKTIQNLKTGTKKTIPADKADMYLKDPNFQEVQ